VEKLFFDWENWEEIEAGVNQYLDCVLTAPIGKHGPKEHFDCIIVNFQSGVMTLQRNNVEWSYKLILQVGDEVRN